VGNPVVFGDPVFVGDDEFDVVIFAVQPTATIETAVKKNTIFFIDPPKGCLEINSDRQSRWQDIRAVISVAEKIFRTDLNSAVTLIQELVLSQSRQGVFFRDIRSAF